MSTQDEVELSVHERQKLARMQATLQAADPRLARVLGNQVPQEPGGLPPVWRHSRLRFVAKLTRVWVGLTVVVAGLALTMVTVASSLWSSVLGCLITTAGLGLSGKAFERRWALQARTLPARTDVAG
jgi:hypothetical protein